MRRNQPEQKTWVFAAAGVFLAAVFLLASGIRWDTLPFNPGARFSDAVTSHLPAAAFLRESIMVDEAFPVWRDTIMAGQPFAANPLNKVMYPPQWLAVILPPVFHLQAMIGLHLLIAGWGMWRWMRALGLRPEAAAFAALMYAMSPRMIGHLGAGHVDIVYAMAWLPHVMLAARNRSVLPFALTAALMIIGDVRVGYFGMLLAIPYGVVQAVHDKQIKQLPVRMIITGVILSVLLAGLVLSYGQWAVMLTRGSLTQEDAAIFSLTPAQLIGVIIPATGNIETLTSIGVIVLALAIIGAMQLGKRGRFWLIALVLAVLYALGSNGFLWTMLTDLIPSLLSFRVPSRAWILVTLIVVVLAAHGADALFRWAAQARMLTAGSGPRPTMPMRAVTLITLVLAVAAVVIGGTVLANMLPLPKTSGAALIAGGVGLAVLVVALNRAKQAEFLLHVVGVLAFVELAIIGGNWLEWRGGEDWLEPYADLAQFLVDDGADRIYSPTYSLPQNVAQLYHLQLFGGVDPFQVAHVTQAIRIATYANANASANMSLDVPYSVVQPPLDGIVGDDPATANRFRVYDTRWLGAWGVSHVISAFPIAQQALEYTDTVDGVFIYRNANYNPAYDAAAIPAWVDYMLYGVFAAPDSDFVAEVNANTQTWFMVSMVGFAGVTGAIIIQGARRRIGRHNPRV